jgi:hypothetical protein
MKVKCHERHCNWQGYEDEILVAEHPFGYEGAIIGCPKCKSIATIDYVCDEQGCWEVATCGTPSIDGYRHTCLKHKPVEEKRERLSKMHLEA